MLATKTALIYRSMFDLEVKQDIDTMLYCANDILEAYNKKTGENKRLDVYLRTDSTKSYIIELARIQDNLNTTKQCELEFVGDKPKGKVLGVIETKKGKYGGTRMNQHLLIDFMMWLSVEFKHMAIDFILTGQSLALGRAKIAEGYKQMCQAIAKHGSANYREEATMLNVLVSGSSPSNQRARYNEDKQLLMDDMQKANATLINAGLPLEDRKNLLIKQFIN